MLTKITKKLLEQDQTTETTLQQQKLKKPLRITHKNSNKSAVFKDSKNIMARDNHQKIAKKYLKFTI
jgi:hypothetical protein